MTDETKELLTLAAKACGIKKDDSPYNGGGFCNDGFDSMGNMVLDWHNNKRWNPLASDGDAFRLAVKLGFAIHCPDMTDPSAVVEDYNGVHVREESNDHYAATRLAIVKASAAIGKSL